MPRAFCADMRERVIARVESGASRREAAEHYDVSASTAVIWVKCFRETGRTRSSAPVQTAWLPRCHLLTRERPDVSRVIGRAALDFES